MKLTNQFNILNRMRLWQKFLLLGVFSVTAVIFPFYRYIANAEADIAFARDEQVGLSPAFATIRLVQYIQQHRDLSANLLAGNTANGQSREAKAIEIEQVIAEVDRYLAAPAFTPVRDSWNEVKKNWKTVSTGVATRSMDARASFDAHTKLVTDALATLEVVADSSKLSLDPASHTYFLIQATTNHFPLLTEALSQVRSLGAVRLADAARSRGMPEAATSDIDRARISSLLQTTRTSFDNSYRFVEKAMREDPRLKGILDPSVVSSKEAVRQLDQLVRRELLDVKTPTYDPAAYSQAFAGGIDAQFKLLFATADVLRQELDLTVADKRRAEIVIALQILAALIVAILVGVLTVRNVRATVSRLQDSVERVRSGDDAALEDIDVADEVGDLGRTVNQLLTDRLAAQRKAEAEGERLNGSVIAILQAVHQLSQRDLTTRAPVSQDIVGTVSDSINSLTEETAKVLSGVSGIANKVAEASGNVRSQAEQVSKTAEDERASIARMVASLNEATQTMERVTGLANQSNISAIEATTATETALQTVNGTVRGMESIRETIAETEKRIKRLGERSQEISGIVNLINTISERTHVLALNASMQAAVAGEAGRGFAVVAEEVQRLAESSRNATQQIATLVSNIQLETNETIGTVNRTIGQVVEGSELAQKAGEQMRRTQEITAELVAQVRRIGEASHEQKAMSDSLLSAVQRIGESTERTGEQIEAQNRETETLLHSAKRLIDSVNVFKLPVVA